MEYFSCDQTARHSALFALDAKRLAIHFGKDPITGKIAVFLNDISVKELSISLKLLSLVRVQLALSYRGARTFLPPVKYFYLTYRQTMVKVPTG